MVTANFQKVIGQAARYRRRVGNRKHPCFAMSIPGNSQRHNIIDIALSIQTRHRKSSYNPNGGDSHHERTISERIASFRRTRISLATLRRWRLENKGPKYHKFGSLVRYDEDELNQWAQAQPSGGDDPNQRITPQSERGAVRLKHFG